MKIKKSQVDKYTYFTYWSEEDKVFISECAEFPGLKAHGSSQDESLKEIKTAVLGAMEWLEEEGKPIPEPLSLHKFSGKLVVRMPRELHKRLAIQSTQSGVSLNQYILSKLSS